MSSRGDLLSTAFAVGSFAGLFLYKQQQTRGQVLAAQAKTNAEETAQSEVNLSLQWNHNRLDSLVEGFAKRLLQSQKLNVDWPLVVVSDLSIDDGDAGFEERRPQEIKKHTDANSFKKVFRLSREKVTFSSSMVDDSPLNIFEKEEEAGKLKSETKADKCAGAQVDSQSVSQLSPVLKGSNALVYHGELEEVSRNPIPGTPQILASNKFFKSTFSNSVPGDDDTSIISTSSKAQRRTIFGARVRKKYVRRSNVGALKIQGM